MWVTWRGLFVLGVRRTSAFLVFISLFLLLFLPGVLSTGMFYIFAPLIVAFVVSWDIGWTEFWSLQRPYFSVTVIGGFIVLGMGLICWRWIQRARRY